MTTMGAPDAATAKVLAAMEADDRTLAWLARRAGIPRSTLRHQLSNPGRLTVENLLRIADALGRPVERLVP
jgi:lambda repressor-like predicted transcriptional regulator